MKHLFLLALICTALRSYSQQNFIIKHDGDQTTIEETISFDCLDSNDCIFLQFGENPILDRNGIITEIRFDTLTLNFYYDNCYSAIFGNNTYIPKLINTLNIISNFQHSKIKYKLGDYSFINTAGLEWLDAKKDEVGKVDSLFIHVLKDFSRSSDYAYLLGHSSIIGGDKLLLPSFVNHEISHANYRYDNTDHANCSLDELNINERFICKLKETFGSILPISWLAVDTLIIDKIHSDIEFSNTLSSTFPRITDLNAIQPEISDYVNNIASLSVGTITESSFLTYLNDVNFSQLVGPEILITEFKYFLFLKSLYSDDCSVKLLEEFLTKVYAALIKKFTNQNNAIKQNDLISLYNLKKHKVNTSLNYNDKLVHIAEKIVADFNGNYTMTNLLKIQSINQNKSVLFKKKNFSSNHGFSFNNSDSSSITISSQKNIDANFLLLDLKILDSRLDNTINIEINSESVFKMKVNNTKWRTLFIPLNKTSKKFNSVTISFPNKNNFLIKKPFLYKMNEIRPIIPYLMQVAKLEYSIFKSQIKGNETYYTESEYILNYGKAYCYNFLNNYEILLAESYKVAMQKKDFERLEFYNSIIYAIETFTPDFREIYDIN